MEMAALIAILVVVLGILAAVKSGFNEVIKGLEAVEQRLSQGRQS